MKLCNRCHHRPQNELPIYIALLSESGNEDRYGLCDKCADSLYHWMFGFDGTDVTREYN